MDGRAEQRSAASSTGSTATANPGIGLSSVKRAQSLAAKVAAQRLAEAMASQSNEDDGEADSPFRCSSFRGSDINSSASESSRSAEPQSPALGTNYNWHASTTHSTSAGSPSIAAHPETTILSSGPTGKQRSSKPPLDPIADVQSGKRFSADIGHLNFQDESCNQWEAASLQDEIDLLQDENGNLLDKLRVAEQKLQQVEAKARELERQVASLGEGISLEARFLSRKEVALRQREAAFKAKIQTKDVQDDEIAAFRLEVKIARDEATIAIEQLQVADAEAKSLYSMMQRMVLTQEEMEEVVLKRCWLARYWGLAVRHGIHAEIASSKHEHWLSLAPLPLELVMSTGQRAKEDSMIHDVAANDGGDDELDNFSRFEHQLNDMSGDGNIEGMLAVEKGLHELASLKIWSL